jgi:hypothetical protein
MHMDSGTGILSYVLLPVTSHIEMICPTYLIYLALYHYTRTVMVQLPMHVLHGICYGYTYSDDDQI